jgi:hypothetical protein
MAGLGIFGSQIRVSGKDIGNFAHGSFADYRNN